MKSGNTPQSNKRGDGSESHNSSKSRVNKVLITEQNSILEEQSEGSQSSQ